MESDLVKLVLGFAVFSFVLFVFVIVQTNRVRHWRRQTTNWRERCAYNTARMTTAMHGFLATKPPYPAFNAVSIKTVIGANEQSGRPHADIVRDYEGLLKCTDSPAQKKQLRDLIRAHGGTVIDSEEDILERLTT